MSRWPLCVLLSSLRLLARLRPCHTYRPVRVWCPTYRIAWPTHDTLRDLDVSGPTACRLGYRPHN